MPRKQGPVEKAKDFKGTLKKLLNELKQYRMIIIIVLVFAILSTIFNIVGPRILGDATTEIYQGIMSMIAGTGGINLEKIAEIMIWLLALYIASSLFAYVQAFLMAGISNKFTYNLRKKIQAKINKLPLKYFDKKTHGEILSYITNDIDTITQNLSQGITQIITSGATLIGILIMMFSISWQMTIIALLVLPISLSLIFAVMKRSQKYFKGNQKYLGNVNGHIEEMYSNHNIVKAFNGEKDSIDKFNIYNDKLYKAGWKSQFLSGLTFPIINLISNIGYVGICIAGAFFASNGIITVGNIQSFIQYTKQFTHPLIQFANITSVLQATVAASERVFGFLEEEEEVKDIDNPVSVDNIKGKVEFKHVNFGYTDDKTVIHDFSAVAEAGKRIAIVGPTGAGKTTIVKLLMRYYDVNKGEIDIDGINIKNFKRDDLRSMFAMVLQDTWAFNGSIMENIRYGKLDSTDEEVIKAAKSAQVDYFVRTLSDGYNTILNEDSGNISQGQKQLLTIARAFLANKKLLILDEATSSVDTRTEMQIQKAMQNLMKGRTCFIIAHRLSTIKDADLILVMNDGDIVEQGTHKQLLEQGGFYEKLYNSQFEDCDDDIA